MLNSPDDPFIVETRAWVERVVIGLKLCPFAPAPALKGLIRYATSEVETREALLEDLATELQHLVASPPEEVETTLLVHPQVLQDFHDFNDFLEIGDLVKAEAYVNYLIKDLKIMELLKPEKLAYLK